MVDFKKALEKSKKSLVESNKNNTAEEKHVYQVYVDGSGIFEKNKETGHNKKQTCCKRAYAVYCNGKLITRKEEDVDLKGKNINPTNITGECSAALHGMRTALQYMLSFAHRGELQILHDYVGLKHWAEGSWKANAEGPKQYAIAINKMINIAKENGIHVTFVKVARDRNKAHILFKEAR